MVRWWDKQVDRSIALTKARIKHCEAHGMGDTAIREKAVLKKQERHKQVRKDEQ